MKVKIENEYLSVEADTSGAELSSLFSRKEQKEYLWQGDPEWWPRKAPVLFPFVGKLNNNSYTLNGQIYSMGQHGFARDKEFVLITQTKDQLVFSLTSDQETLKNYPFEFELQIKYGLEANKLTTTYEVKNTGNIEILFSIGAHPGFNYTGSLEDHYLEFEKAENLDRHLLSDGAFNGEKEKVMNNTNILDLNEELFRKDAIVFKHMKSNWMSLKSNSAGSYLKFSFHDFPYFGIWKKPGAEFICLEPWCGIADNKSFEGELRNKEGIVSLNAGKSFVRSFWVEVDD